MSKPHNAIELSIAADLTSCSFQDALTLITEKAMELGWYKSRIISNKILRVPSQLMGIAIMLRVEDHFHIDISFTYGVDEWSLHREKYNGLDKEDDEIIVWSPGA